MLGDFNANGIVDAADYVVWRNSLGVTGSGLAADGNGDNMVTQLDYAIWKANFGDTAGGDGGSAECLVGARAVDAFCCSLAGSWIATAVSRRIVWREVLGSMKPFIHTLRIAICSSARLCVDAVDDARRLGAAEEASPILRSRAWPGCRIFPSRLRCAIGPR